MNELGLIIAEMAETPQGRALAFVLASVSAIAHATFGALVKGGVDPYLNRGAINFCYALGAAPFALFVLPPPDGTLVLVLMGTYLIHLAFEWFQTAAFARGDFVMVYPIARGTAPLLVAIGSIILFREHFEFFQWIGMAVLILSIFGLAMKNIMRQRDEPGAVLQLRQAILLSLTAGAFTAFYTLYDAFGVRHADNPFTYIAWVFFLGGFGFPFLAARRWVQIPQSERPAISLLIRRGVIGAAFAYVSFGSLMLATRLDHVGEAAALRETSIVFATVIGMLFLGEKLDRHRLFLILFVFVGAMLVEFAHG